MPSPLREENKICFRRKWQMFSEGSTLQSELRQKIVETTMGMPVSKSIIELSVVASLAKERGYEKKTH